MTAVVSLDQAIRAKLAARPLARNIRTDDDQARANAWMIRTQNALLAVLDLHKPRPAGIVGKPHVTDCSVCLDVGPEVCSPVGYPCDTIEAIAEKLGVEVHGG